jgi:hypothetical protein
MTWRSLSPASVAATLLLPALPGCAYLHKDVPPPVSITAQAPSRMAAPLTPLYTELSQNDPSLPDLPTPPVPGAQPTPPPVSVVVVDTAKKPAHPTRRHGRKGEYEVAEREVHAREARERETPEGASPSQNSTPPEKQNVKVTPPTPSGDTTQPTPIGQLTAGPTPETSGSRQQAVELIDSTQRGVNSLRNLNGDQNKTAAQIRSFLEQAQRALHNGDLDGAHTLATKAKTLLDELTGAS